MLPPGCPAGAPLTHQGGLPRETATAWVWEPGHGTEQGSLSFCFPQRHVLFNISFIYLSRSELCEYMTCSNKLRIKNKHTRKTVLCVFLTAPPANTHKGSGLTLPQTFHVLGLVCIRDTECSYPSVHTRKAGPDEKDQPYQVWTRMWSNWNSPAVQVGMDHGAVSLENSWAFLQMFNIHLPHDPVVL